MTLKFMELYRDNKVIRTYEQWTTAVHMHAQPGDYLAVHYSRGTGWYWRGDKSMRPISKDALPKELRLIALITS